MRTPDTLDAFRDKCRRSRTMIRVADEPTSRSCDSNEEIDITTSSRCFLVCKHFVVLNSRVNASTSSGRSISW